MLVAQAIGMVPRQSSMLRPAVSRAAEVVSTSAPGIIDTSGASGTVLKLLTSPLARPKMVLSGPRSPSCFATSARVRPRAMA